MTPQQQQVLDLIQKLNDGEFEGWFLPSEVMAFCQIESAFRPKAYRFEPRLGEGSYGLMQVLASTARSVEPSLVDPEKMYDPEVGLRIGMKVARLYWSQERLHFGRDPTREEWVASYNEGVGGAIRDVNAGREPDPAYTKAWNAAFAYWEAELSNPPRVISTIIPSARVLQVELAREGLYTGGIDGDWGRLSQAALAAHYRLQN